MADLSRIIIQSQVRAHVNLLLPPEAYFDAMSGAGEFRVEQISVSEHHGGHLLFDISGTAYIGHRTSSQTLGKRQRGLTLMAGELYAFGHDQERLVRILVEAWNDLSIGKHDLEQELEW